AVITARDDAGDGAGGVAAEAVGDEPLARGERLGVLRVGGRPLDAANWLLHDGCGRIRRCGGRTAAAPADASRRRSTPPHNPRESPRPGPATCRAPRRRRTPDPRSTSGAPSRRRAAAPAAARRTIRA